MDPEYTHDTDVKNVLAAPSVRHLARQNGIDLARLAPGSGKGGRIEKKDVDLYLSTGGAQVSNSFGATGADNMDVVVELGRTRYGMWKAMTKVRQLITIHPCSNTNFASQSLEIPHFG